MKPEDELSRVIIGAAIDVHREFGPGLFEVVYKKALVHELALREIPCRREVEYPLLYRGEPLGESYRADIIVNEIVLVEAKVASSILPIHKAQVRTYLQASSLKLGIILNFNTKFLKDGGIFRVANNL